MIAGRYRLDREIGRGGMGSVWLARDELLGRTVAIKRIGLAPGGSASDLARAEREARLAAMLNHPHVVAVFDLVIAEDQRWLVMEYVDGETLAALVTREGPLPPDRAASLLVQAADALTAAHTAGIVHRDVKPSNILVTREGQVRLSDFGIARAEADAALTQTGMVTGSPAYLAPEVATGRTATPQSDVWSLGATLFHALSGHPPYEVGDNLIGALYRIVHEEPPRLPDAGWLAPLLEATMTRDPQQRWSMRQVRDFLAAGPRRAGDEGGPTVAVVPSSPPPATRPEPDPEVTQPMPASPAKPGQPAGAPPPAPTAPEPRPLAATPAPPPSSPDAGARRRRLLVPLLVAAAVLGALAWVWWGGVAGDNGTGGASRPGASETSEAPPARPTARGMTRFIQDYLATVTEDRRAAFAMLTPAFQEASGGFEGYDGFWSTIDSARPSNITADPESLTVSYTVDYVQTDGTLTEDQVRLALQFEDGTYLIAGEA